MKPIIILLLLMLTGETGPAPPPGIPQGAGHPDAEHMQLYDQNCCNKNDCEPIPNEAVRERADVYHVEYLSRSPSIGWVKGVVPFADAKASHGCIDGMCMHACATRATKPIANCSGMYDCLQFDFTKPSVPHCLYVSQSF